MKQARVIEACAVAIAVLSMLMAIELGSIAIGLGRLETAGRHRDEREADVSWALRRIDARLNAAFPIKHNKR